MTEASPTESTTPDPDLAALRAMVRGHQLAVMLRGAAELGLADETLSDDQLLDAMVANPIVIERPLVVTDRGVKLCRPSEAVLDLLPPLPTPFTKEDGQQVG